MAFARDFFSGARVTKLAEIDPKAPSRRQIALIEFHEFDGLKQPRGVAALAAPAHPGSNRMGVCFGARYLRVFV